MKKLFKSALFFLILFGNIWFPFAAHAAGFHEQCAPIDPTKSTCTSGLTCDDQAVNATYGQCISAFTCSTPCDAEHPVCTSLGTCEAAPASSAGNTTDVSGFKPLVPIPGLTGGSDGAALPTVKLTDFLNNLYKYLVGLAAILAVIEIIWGGLEISTQESVSKHSDGRNRITQALLGLVLVLSPVLVFSIINPSILNLSISLENIKTNGGGGIVGGPPGTTDPATGCVGVGQTGILEIAQCDSQEKANAWGARCTYGALSTESVRVSGSGGGVYKYIATCTGGKDYLFLDLSTNRALNLNAIADLRPLLHTPENPNNGDEANQFVSICNSAGLERSICIDDDPLASGDTACPPYISDFTSGEVEKCYVEHLSCRDNSIIDFSYCDDNPSWSPVP